MSERTLSVLDGSTFVVSDRLGDVRADEGREHGFFSEDTRFISRWVLRVDETPLELLSLDQSAHFDARFFLTPGVGPDDEAPCSVMRHRLVDHVWIEEIIVTNHRHETSRQAWCSRSTRTSPTSSRSRTALDAERESPATTTMRR